MTTINTATLLASTPRPFDLDDSPGQLFWYATRKMPVQADNSSVVSLPDFTKNAYNATQASAGDRGVYKTNIVNGLPIVRFAGGEWYEMPIGVYQAFSNLSDFVMFFVCKVTDLTDARTVICIGDTDQAPRIFLRYNITTGIATSRVLATSGGNVNAVDSLAAVSGFHIIELSQTGAAKPLVELLVDGVSQGTDNAATVTYATTDFSQGLIGANLTSGGSAAFFDGDFAEATGYANLALSYRNRIRQKLATIYGIALP